MTGLLFEINEHNVKHGLGKKTSLNGYFANIWKDAHVFLHI